MLILLRRYHKRAAENYKACVSPWPSFWMQEQQVNVQTFQTICISFQVDRIDLHNVRAEGQESRTVLQDVGKSAAVDTLNKDVSAREISCACGVSTIDEGHVEAVLTACIECVCVRYTPGTVPKAWCTQM